MNAFHVGNATLLDRTMVEHRKLASYFVTYLSSYVVVRFRIEPLSASLAVDALEEAL